MKGLSLMLIGICLVTGLLFIWLSPSVHRMQRDFQAYSTRSLLPEDMPARHGDVGR